MNRFGVMNKLLMGAGQTDTNVFMLPRTDILLASDIDIKILHTTTPQTGNIKVMLTQWDR